MRADMAWVIGALTGLLLGATAATVAVMALTADSRSFAGAERQAAVEVIDAYKLRAVACEYVLELEREVAEPPDSLKL